MCAAAAQHFPRASAPNAGSLSGQLTQAVFCLRSREINLIVQKPVLINLLRNSDHDIE